MFYPKYRKTASIDGLQHNFWYNDEVDVLIDGDSREIDDAYELSKNPIERSALIMATALVVTKSCSFIIGLLTFFILLIEKIRTVQP